MIDKLWKATACCALFAAGAASAKDLYVNPSTGNDSTTYANNNASNPWRTLGRATWGSTNRSSPNNTQAAQAGDVVHVAAGTYSAPASNLRLDPAFNPVNTGTASAPITFRAEGRVELRTPGGTGPAFGAYVRNYIRWEGHFFVDETYNVPHGDTGPVVIWDTTGTVIDGCEIQGRPITYVDNHNGVRINGARDSVLRNCRINNIVGTTDNLYHHNNAGVMLYYSSGIVMENNEITNSGSGIFPKGGDNNNITIRFNKLVNNRKAIRNSFSAPGSGNNRMYQNIVWNSTQQDMGIDLAENTNNWTIANNTLYNVQNGFWLEMTGTSQNNRIANNIVSNTKTGMNGWMISAPIPGPGRNLYYQNQEWAWNSRVYTSISAYLGAAVTELGSVNANPLFVNTSTGDAHLQQASPAIDLGVDILDLDGDGSTTDRIPAGAYVRGNEVIGRNVGPVPNPPTNTTVQ
jgi:hypothetical protein